MTTPTASTADAESDPPAGEPPEELLVITPRDGVPDLIDTPRGLTRALESLAQGTGPIAIDAERASGFRYGQRAYLIQLHRVDGGTWLIDPIALPDLHRLAEFVAPLEWILHAATQDLPCLAEVGLRPTRLFDTELAGRLLGRDRVGLGPLVAAELGWHLAKGHGAADWSTRPLPEEWRAYAALDVEVLPALRDRLAQDLDEAGKTNWAQEEFDALVAFEAPPPRTDPWRRTSGIHAVRDRRGLAVVQSLWEERDRIARERDLAPGRILPDAAIVSVASRPPTSAEGLDSIKAISKGRGGRFRSRWWAAISSALELPAGELPELALRGDGPPPPRMWGGKDPEAAQRLARAKAGLAQLSADWNIPVENLATPDSVRRVLWRPPHPANAASIDEALDALGIRAWQRSLITPVLVEAIQPQAT